MSNTDRRNEYRSFDQSVLGEFLDGRKILNSELVGTGKSNTNYLLDLSDGVRVVFRLYSPGSPSSPQRESKVFEILGSAVPVPRVLESGEDWAVFEFVKGRTLADDPASTASAARAIAALANVRFDMIGWINEAGDIVPFDFGDDYFEERLSNDEVRTWLGVDRTEALGGILGSEASRLAEINGQPSLTHGDFNPTNVLVEYGELRAILDWEYAHAGTPYMDIGNLMRNTPMEFHAEIGRGLVEGGFELPDDWGERAELVDMSSHLEFLTSSRSEEFKRTRIELIDRFIGRFS